MTTRLPTFHEAALDARVWARDDFAEHAADGADVHDHVCDAVDQCSYVIYNAEAFSIWLSSSVVQEYEDEAAELVESTASISERVSACVCLALREVYVAEWAACDARTRSREASERSE